MIHINKSDTESHDYYDGAVSVTEFNFPGDTTINDAKITIKGRYPMSGYAVNDISTALVSVESGSGSITVKESNPQELKEGDRLLIKPGEPYAFYAHDALSIRYIATPAWTLSQARIIES